MATLNTLRTRGGVIVTIVIGVSLIAFLLTDMLASGGSFMNSSKMRVGAIDGKNIGYVEYSNQVDFYTNIFRVMNGSESSSTQEQDNIRDMAWNAMISDYAFNPGFEALGIMPGEEEQVDMVSGIYLSPVITSTFVGRNGWFDPMELSNFIERASTDQSGQMAMLWDYLKRQMNEQRTMSKYINIIAKGLYATDLEAADGVVKANGIYDISYVNVPYASIPDSTVSVSKSEIKDYYNKTKSQYKRGATREIEYVVFNILPSEQDYADSQDRVDEMANEFRTTDTPMQYANLNSQSAPDQRFYNESQIEAAIAAVVFGKPGAIYGPVLGGDRYTMARQAEMRYMPDSVGAKHILLPPTDGARADSLVRTIRGGSNFASLAIQFSMDENSSMNGGDMGVFDPQDLMTQLPQFAQACLNASQGEVFKIVAPYGIQVVQLTYKSPMVRKAQIAQITYDVEPSPATQQVIYGQAGKFYSAAVGSSDKFDRAATEEAVSKRNATVRNTDRIVNGLPESRELVRWAFNADKGAVSTIMEFNDSYVIATVKGKTDEGYASVESVEPQIKTVLMQQKKGDMLAAKMGGASLGDIAQANSTDVKESAGVSFESFFLSGIGVETQLIGAVCGLGKAGELSKPVKGATGVFVFEIDDVTSEANADPQSEKVRLEATAQGYITERVGQALIEVSNVVDNRVKFF